MQCQLFEATFDLFEREQQFKELVVSLVVIVLSLKPKLYTKFSLNKALKYPVLY